LLRPGRRDLRLRLRPMPRADVDVATPAWEALRAELVRFVRSRVADAAAADDVVHDVLLRALAELEGPRPPVDLRAWLYRVTRNAIVDHYRARRPAVDPPAELAAASDDEPSAEAELAGCLTPLLATLPPADREALALTEVNGVKQRELAAAIGVTESTMSGKIAAGPWYGYELQVVADTLGTTLAVIYGIEDMPPAPITSIVGRRRRAVGSVGLDPTTSSVESRGLAPVTHIFREAI